MNVVTHSTTERIDNALSNLIDENKEDLATILDTFDLDADDVILTGHPNGGRVTIEIDTDYDWRDYEE